MNKDVAPASGNNHTHSLSCRTKIVAPSNPSYDAKNNINVPNDKAVPRMIALSEYERLEASALWRPEGETQHRDVVVSVGEATLTISDLNDKPLGHWSLPAIERTNGTNEKCAIYRPAPDSEEQLEIDDKTMIDAIARIDRAVKRGRSRPGRLRGTLLSVTVLACVGLGVLWVPNALIGQAVQIVPAVTRADIGDQLLQRIRRLTGAPCDTIHGSKSLVSLGNRLSGSGQLIVVQSGVELSQHLPGGIILLNKSLVEDYDNADVISGYILAEKQRAAQVDPLRRLLSEAGLMTTLRLLTSGKIPETALDSHSESLLTAWLAPADQTALIDRFVAAEVAIKPFAYAVDITGETTLHLIEADGVQVEITRPVLSDGDWVALQGVCDG